MKNMKSIVASLSLLALLIGSCRHSAENNSADLLSLETSAALEESCRRDSVTADSDYFMDVQNELGSCLGSSAEVKSWSGRMMSRMEMNWPRDFLDRGKSARECLQKLTYGAQSRYLEALLEACRAGDAARKRELITDCP